MSSTGLNLNSLFNNMSTTVANKAIDIQKGIDSIDPTNIDQTLMLKVQFDIGMYNTLLETTSTVTKSLVDETKQIAQRAS